MMVIADCRELAALIPPYMDGSLPVEERDALDGHLRGCPNCREALARFGQFQNLAGGLFGPALGKDFNAETGKRLQAIRARARDPQGPGAVPDHAAEVLEAPASESWTARLGVAPWWAISVALHGLVLVLLGLLTMAIGQPEDFKALVVVTPLFKRVEAKEVAKENTASALRDILERREVASTDPQSQAASDVVVPPDLLAKAELGDHFETVNPDRPYTQSAFGNPDARLFHSASGNAELEGGGGMSGASLSDDLIGLGGGSSPGSGGGWGGGTGTGTGLGNGSGNGSFGQRTGGGRRLMVRKFGGSPATESAVDAALYWLARHQEADGHWDMKKNGGGAVVSGAFAYDESITALAVLAFLGAGHTTKIGLYKDTVRKAVDWIVSRQQADGSIGHPATGYGIYDLSIGTLALAEACAMSRDAKLGEAAQKGIDCLMKHQQEHGGWNHDAYKSSSVLGWCVMALKSAKIAGLKVPAQGFEGALKRLATVSEKTADGYWGMVGYQAKGQHTFNKGITLTAVGMVCLEFMGFGGETAPQAEVVEKVLPKWQPKADIMGEPQDFYFWYYGTLGLFQHGGAGWKRWNEALKETLLPNQHKGGIADGGPQDLDGSWDYASGWSPAGGRVYSTAMGALCLEVYYRYLPMYK